MRFLSALLCLTVLVNTMESSPVAPDGYEPPVGGRAVRGGIFDIPTQVTIGEPSNTNVPVPDGDITPVDTPIKIAVGGRAVSIKNILDNKYIFRSINFLLYCLLLLNNFKGLLCIYKSLEEIHLDIIV
ncbi:uncharacterized protein LOC106073653 [Biomphalaria glabrata]|uniref:Uncharacterized protein LOC106073653 n=1 Tax=Biomphalaria glabrata TaxID=6526 RepID=A0A9W2YWJ6_BIOGL|nr:uncharacterized protein LOC106073653 [Biomphalaria glabrata]